MIKAKKSLGQNFLIDLDVIDQILEVTKIKDKNILEIGPGTGNLTSEILKKKPSQLTVIEKDKELVNILKNNFGSDIIIINEDVLKFNENQFNKKMTVFGNLPYNISTEILCKWILNLDSKNFWFDGMVLMFQKEVAERITSSFNIKSYGRLSIISNWKLDIKKIIDIKPSAFSPKPKVESTVLFFKPKKNFFNIENPKNLEKITRIFFMHRRKMIKKPYNQIFEGNGEIANKLKIDLNLRPQNLNFETYFKLVNEYEKLRS
jgi:16S rRNA (adenine1518-N6/adenine1519-N6)-dimethyltransferase